MRVLILLELPDELKSLWKRGEKRKFRYTEVVISEAVVGKYREFYFVVTENVTAKADGLEVVIAREVNKAEDWKSFRYGKYLFDGKRLMLECEFSEELFYDLIPGFAVRNDAV